MSSRSTWHRPSVTGWRRGSAWPTRRSSRGSRTGEPSSSATWRRCAPTWPRCARCPPKSNAASRCLTPPQASALAPPGLTLGPNCQTRRYRWTIEGKDTSRALGPWAPRPRVLSGFRGKGRVSTRAPSGSQSRRPPFPMVENKVETPPQHASILALPAVRAKSADYCEASVLGTVPSALNPMFPLTLTQPYKVGDIIMPILQKNNP